jgi:hypothetical protein
MLEQIDKLHTELTKELSQAAKAYTENPEADDATHKAIKALFKNMEILNEGICQLLNLGLRTSDRVQILSACLTDQEKLLNAANMRMKVFGSK